MRTQNNKGMALITALFFSVILFGLSTVFIVRTVHETKMAKFERESSKSFYAAQAGSQAGLVQVDVLINDNLLNTVASANPNGVISYAQSKVSSGDGIGWLVYSVRDNDTPVLTQDGEEALHSGGGTVGGVAYTYAIYMTEKDDPSAVGVDAWDFPFSYSVVSSATSNGMSSEVRILGDFTIRLQRDNFAKYALFTNSQTMPSGTNVWFTDSTNFNGPVHTNGRFNFALNPSGTFDEEATQQDQRARFYNNGWSVLLDDDHNGTRDVPVFNDGYSRGEDEVVLNSSVEEQDMIDQATDETTYGSDGIYVPNNGSSLTGGIYVKGDGNVTLSVDGSSNPVYTIQQGGSTKAITVDQINNQTSVFNSGTGTTDVYSGLPDGQDDVGTLIFVDGDINNLSGTVQADSKVTVSSSEDIVINNHVKYESYTGSGVPGDVGYVAPSAVGADNLLGIVSWNGDVLVGTSAPDNVEIHGTILAANGILQVDNYNSTSVGPRGTATLLGGVITDNYGAFGLFSGSSGAFISGYGRNFVYDQRMQLGEAPPYFPSLNTFVAFTNDITDKIVWQEGD